MGNSTKKELTLDELRAMEKKQRTTWTLMTGIIIVQAVAGIILTIQKGFNIFSFLPFAFLPVTIMMRRNWRKTKDEIESREAAK